MNKEMKDKMKDLPNKEVSFILNSIHITGNTEYTEEQLMNLVCQKVGDEVTIDDLIGMANTITEYYQKNGYISTTAYLPPQKVEDGNVEIVVDGVVVDTINILSCDTFAEATIWDYFKEIINS